MTLADYLRQEETADARHEFHNGRVGPRDVGNYIHARITTNLTSTIGNRLDGKPCEVLDSNMRVATQATRRFVYPDATILCEPPAFHPDDPKQTTIINPRVVFEVLSESTEGYDRGEKFNHYRRIDALEEYILLAQDRPLVEGFWRQNDGTWSMAAWEGAEAIASIRCLGVNLPLTELYAGALDASA